MTLWKQIQSLERRINLIQTGSNQTIKPCKSNDLQGFDIKTYQILVTTAGFKPSAGTPIFYKVFRNSNVRVDDL